jgi:hypothetical protein
MTIDKVHEIMRLLLVSERTGKNTPEEIDNALHLGQIDYFNSVKPQQGSALPVMGQGTAINESLNPFRVVKDFTNSDTPSGILSLPESEHVLAVQVQTTSGSGIKQYYAAPMMNDDELAHRLDSQLVGPTERYPVVSPQGCKKIKFYPETPKAGRVFYLKTPEAPKWAYVENGRDLKYSAGRSQDLEWNDIHIPQVIMRALQYLGVNLEAETVFQAAQLKQSETR